MKKTLLLSIGIFVLSGNLYAETAQELMDKQYAKWLKEQDASAKLDEEFKLKNVKKRSNTSLKSSMDTMKSTTVSMKPNKPTRQEIMNAEYNEWLKKQEIVYPINKKTSTLKNNNIKSEYKISKNFTLEKGNCSLMNMLDKSILLKGDCSLLSYNDYPKLNVLSFNNSRDFFFQKEKENWVLKEKNINDKNVTFSQKNNSLIFKTDLYKIVFNEN